MYNSYLEEKKLGKQMKELKGIEKPNWIKFHNSNNSLEKSLNYLKNHRKRLNNYIFAVP